MLYQVNGIIVESSFKFVTFFNVWSRLKVKFVLSESPGVIFFLNKLFI